MERYGKKHCELTFTFTLLPNNLGEVPGNLNSFYGDNLNIRFTNKINFVFFLMKSKY